jgi:RNA polymerase sigma-70 factor (ECF subfamily)
MLSLREAQTRPRQEAGATSEPIAALAAHDPKAWQDLFDRYYRKMYDFAYVRTGDVHTAEEVASEVFVAAARGIGRYKETGAPFAAWLYRIARNITADHLDRRRRHAAVSIDVVDVASSAWDGSVDDAADIASALGRLTDEQKHVIVLRFFKDCTLEEAAAALGKSVGAVKLLQHRALAALRKQLDAGGGSWQ